MLQAVALALGGRAGARLAGALACAVSRSTLLRLIRAPRPAGPTPVRCSVSMISRCAGHVYATMLIDVETRQPVDVLAERTAESFARLAGRPPWRRGHLPGPGRGLRQVSGIASDGRSLPGLAAVQAVPMPRQRDTRGLCDLR